MVVLGVAVLFRVILEVAVINTLVRHNKVTQVVVRVLVPAVEVQGQLGQAMALAVRNLREALEDNHLLPEPQFIMRVEAEGAIKVLWVGVKVASVGAGQEEQSDHLQLLQQLDYLTQEGAVAEAAILPQLAGMVDLVLSLLGILLNLVRLLLQVQM
jgi:hypothetical protein